MIPLLQAAAALLLVVFFLTVLAHRRRARARAIAHLPSPPPGSWLVGNLPDLFRPDNVGDAEFAWIKTFGTAMKIKGAFGADILFTADPKALNYILNTSGYHFPKPQQRAAAVRLIAGKGLVWANGEQHARHRKVMNPAFSYSALRTFLPLFRHTAQRTVAKWKDVLAQHGGTACVIDIPSWMARSTLDATGAAAFDYDFGALDEGTDNELANVYRDLFVDTRFRLSDLTLAFEALWGYVPEWLVVALQRLPTRQQSRLRHYMRTARRVARALVARQTQPHAAAAAGKDGGTDVMSILVRANLSEDPKRKLSEEELLAQLTTLMLAGHETTASTLTWALHELARHPAFQGAVRAEIGAARARCCGGGELGVAELDAMPCVHALMKETLRFHPIAPLLEREAGRDDVIPLAGEAGAGVPVRKGQHIMMSIAAYNRLPEVWGADADTWRAERWLDGGKRAQRTGLGVIGNLATFSSGVRACIGWRFAILEIQAVLVELIEHFEFAPPPAGRGAIVRAPAGMMVPMIEGSERPHSELPLTVTAVVPREE